MPGIEDALRMILRGVTMKKIVLAIVVSLSVVTVSHAADNLDVDKDWCLLGIMDKCHTTTSIDLLDKIKRLEIAIKMGSAVYTPEELNHLRSMLADAYYTKELLMERH
jgi:hypothetical protein